jgi:2-polyprenyl-6-methoxyphenol hydroxylase-like FAD-dependent oxidoreductase
VFEERRAPTPPDESRAITWMPGGLEFLDWAGVTPAFDEIGLRRVAHEFWSPSGRLLTVPYDRLDHAHPYTLMVAQHDSERLLEQAALSTGLVDIRRGHTVTGVDETADHGEGAAFTVHGPAGAGTVRADWAVAADGARSTIRRGLGIDQRWRDYGAHSAVADFVLRTDLRTDRSRIVLDPRRPYGFFAFGRDRWRFVYRLEPGEDRAVMTQEASATALLRQRLPRVEIERFLWASSFRLGQGQSETYRRGRWLLAGDSAHAMGPSAGAGMMIGVLGAWRLGLALAETARTGSEQALTRYTLEQRAAATQVQRDNARIFANIALRSVPLAALRSGVLRAAGRIPAVPARMARSEALLHLSPVAAGASSAAGSLRAGGR